MQTAHYASYLELFYDLALHVKRNLLTEFSIYLSRINLLDFMYQNICYD